jgi:hypothetical protein
MSNPSYVYTVQKKIAGNSIFYLFLSEGKRNIIKAIEYSYVQELMDKRLYNLAFGDFDLASWSLLDDPISGNGDHYRVFNTVLQSIPDFFAVYPDALLMVRGSDSRPQFIQKCRLNCKKKCPEGQCKNSHRRITIYLNYVNMNFSALKEEYLFYGGKQNPYNQHVMEAYRKDENYDSVFSSKKEV